MSSSTELEVCHNCNKETHCVAINNFNLCISCRECMACKKFCALSKCLQCNFVCVCSRHNICTVCEGDTCLKCGEIAEKNWCTKCGVCDVCFRCCMCGSCDFHDKSYIEYIGNDYNTRDFATEGRGGRGT